MKVIRMYTGGIEAGPVMRHVLVNMLQGPAEALCLQGDDFVAAGSFDGVQSLVHFTFSRNSEFSIRPEIGHLSQIN